MERVWDYVMRRKAIFFGFAAVFFVSGFTTCQLLRNANTTPVVSPSSPSSEIIDTNLPEDVILSASEVAELRSPEYVHVAVVNPTAPEIAEVPLTGSQPSTLGIAVSVILAAFALTLAGCILYATYLYFLQ